METSLKDSRDSFLSESWWPLVCDFFLKMVILGRERVCDVCGRVRSL